MANMAGVLRGGNTICDIPVRVKLRESHSISNTVTQYGVESGKSISDHVISNPNVVDIEFEMTNTDGGRELAIKTFQDFAELLAKKEPVNLYTEHATYRNMIVESFNPDHVAPNRGAYRATLRLRQMGVIGAGQTVTAAQGGRMQSVLAGDRMYRGTGIARTAQSQETAYRTAVPHVDAGRADSLLDEALTQKVLSALAGYTGDLLSTRIG